MAPPSRPKKISAKDLAEAGPSGTSKRLPDLSQKQQVILVKLAKRKFPATLLNLRQVPKKTQEKEDALKAMSEFIGNYGIERSPAQLVNLFKNLKQQVTSKYDPKGKETGNKPCKRLTAAEKCFSKIIDVCGNNPVLHLVPGAIAAGVQGKSSSSTATSRAAKRASGPRGSPELPVYVPESDEDGADDDDVFDEEDACDLNATLNMICEDFELQQQAQSTADLPPLDVENLLDFGSIEEPPVGRNELEIVARQDVPVIEPRSATTRPRPHVVASTGAAGPLPSASGITANDGAQGRQQQPPRRTNAPAPSSALVDSGTAGLQSANPSNRRTLPPAGRQNGRQRRNFGEDLDFDELYTEDSDDDAEDTSQDEVRQSGRRGRSRSPLVGKRNQDLFNQQASLFDELSDLTAKEKEVTEKKTENLVLKKSILQDVSKKARAEAALAELNLRIREEEAVRMGFTL